ncbi:hypothetical protein CEXT_491781 [Caerostris extrusa]|uniref:Uncharacterized protein n=1 Tax=Caerostris extrusa TaxID=172846 RepID=A0AAV4S7G1_CAEEX|nr:hypothetical protein CEXT_491781 [Caerostris extrusa]
MCRYLIHSTLWLHHRFMRRGSCENWGHAREDWGHMPKGMNVVFCVISNKKCVFLMVIIDEKLIVCWQIVYFWRGLRFTTIRTQHDGKTIINLFRVPNSSRTACEGLGFQCNF